MVLETCEKINCKIESCLMLTYLLRSLQLLRRGLFFANLKKELNIKTFETSNDSPLAFRAA